MKTREQIIAEINAKMADVFEIDEATITPEATISETLELDSISLVDLVSIVHQDYGIKISKEDLTQIITFNNLYDYIETHQKA
ncbi:MAG: acyl carrier protein [Prevotella sp.]|nr:acyl carrier protein [Prevotella sp.]